MKIITCFLITAMLGNSSSSQNIESVTNKKITSGNKLSATVFPELEFANIEGAPKLGTPILLMGKTKPLMAEGWGWASPAVYDWNGDGKKDLLIGEFMSGAEHMRGYQTIQGHFIRVYQNIGTDETPSFEDRFIYAPYKRGEGPGTPISVYNWCCMSIEPRFVDLNADGFPDLISTQFHPQYINWFRGSKEGFLESKRLKQYGWQKRIKALKRNRVAAEEYPVTDPRGSNYWGYSSISFADLDNDGDFDMVVGGGALRISKNIGTKKNPKFGLRVPLIDINGIPLKIYTPSEEDYARQPFLKSSPSGSISAEPIVTDWDGDGIADLLVTDSYAKRGGFAVVFFKGVMKSNSLVFQEGIPLFKAKNGSKEFPGSWLRICVTDWNNDGIKDILIGTSIILDNGAFSSQLSWNYEEETDTGKINSGYYDAWTTKYIEDQILQVEKYDKVRSKVLRETYYGKNNYKSIVHKGYVYLLKGSK